MEDWQEFEYYCIKRHLELYDNHVAWHQSVIPEDELYKAGFIHDFNKTRLLRLAKQREEKGIARYGDYGMDFLAYDEETKTYHACQSKYYKEKRLRAEDLATFMFVIRRTKNIGYLYTLDITKMTGDLRDDIANDTEFIKHIKLPDFKSSTMSIESSINNETEYELRPYQIEAIEAIKGEGRKSIEIACGLGKTLIAGHVLKTSEYKKIICIAPLRVSVDQLMTRIRPFLPGNYKHLLVDSDSEGTTDVDLIKNTIENEEYLVIYSTFKSAQEILDDLLIGDEDEYLIVDEVHNALNMELFVNKFDNILLMSATIQQELYEVFDDVDCVYKYGIADAIKNGYICDYQVSLPFIEGDKNEEVSVSTLENDLDAKIEFLVTGMLKTGSRRCIVYLINCAECNPFTEKLQKHFLEYHGIDKVWCNKIDNGVSSSERKRILKDFQNDKSSDFYIITSVRILDEAIDIPKCDSEFITCVGNSTSDIRTVQRLQRGGRLDKDNINKKNNLFIWCEDWSKTINALSLLKESDIDFNKKIRIINRIYNDGSDKDKEKLVDEKTMELKKYITIKCMNIDEIWKMKYNMLKQYIAEHGKLPQQREEYLGCHLGAWCCTQRKQYDKKILNVDKIKQMEALIVWRWTEKKLPWDQLFNMLNTFMAKNKRMPKRNEIFQGYPLGAWQSKQKTKYNNKTLDSDKIQLFQAINGWKWAKKQKNKNQTWDASYTLLKEFVKENKIVPKRTDIYEGFRIGQWVGKQRLHYTNNILTDNEKIQQLEEIDTWYWSEKKTSKPLTWDEAYGTLLQFIKENNALPKTRQEYKDFKLGEWIVRQRVHYNNNKLDNHKVQKLQEIKIWSWNMKMTWDEVYNSLLQFVKENNTLPKYNQDYKTIDWKGWIDRQKNNKIIGKLTEEQIQMLNQIPNWKWSKKQN